MVTSHWRTRPAAVIAEYLMANHDSLAAVDSGFLGLSKVPAAQLNPLLIRSYATALAPYMGELVGGQQSAFDSLRTQVADDPLALRNLMSVFVADPEAGRTAVEATHSAAEQYEMTPRQPHRTATSRSPTSGRQVHSWAPLMVRSSWRAATFRHRLSAKRPTIWLCGWRRSSFQRTRTPRRSASTYRTAG